MKWTLGYYYYHGDDMGWVTYILFPTCISLTDHRHAQHEEDEISDIRLYTSRTKILHSSSAWCSERKILVLMVQDIFDLRRMGGVR